MKFKKDGLTFSDIIQARDIICGNRDVDRKPYCSICPAVYPEHCKLAQYYMQKRLNIDNCYDFCVNNPRMAAEIMGFEVIEDEESGTAEKPSIPTDISAWTLAQAKEYCMKWRHSHQAPCEETGCELRRRHICMDWVHEWDFDRLTPDELEICKLLDAKWLTREEAEPTVIQLWNEKSRFAMFDGKKAYEGAVAIAQIDPEKFPSVKPGDCINVEELIGGKHNE